MENYIEIYNGYADICIIWLQCRAQHCTAQCCNIRLIIRLVKQVNNAIFDIESFGLIDIDNRMH